MTEGVIIKGVGGLYSVLGPDGTMSFCSARGRFRKERLTPMVGDRVEYTHGDIDNLGMMLAIAPRSTSLTRPAVANVDKVIMALSSSPKPDMMLCEKVLVMAARQGIRPVICLTKSDLGTQAEQKVLTHDYGQFASVYVVSTVTKEGLEALRKEFAGHISVFAGQSGVGKSSLLNALYPEVQLETGALSERIARGRHTTRHAQLLVLPGGGMVMDTPGFSLMELPLMAPQELADAYPDYALYKHQCRFPDCKHGDEPGCAVKAAAEAGALSIDRHDRYCKLLSEVTQKWRNRYRE